MVGGPQAAPLGGLCHTRPPQGSGPHRDTSRTIIIAIAVGRVTYLAIATFVAGDLSLAEIIAAENFSLAEAARPTFSAGGVWFTVGLAVIATASGVMASVFVASRMLAHMNPSLPPSLRDARHRPYPHHRLHDGVRNGTRGRLPAVVRAAILLDVVALAVFIWVKASTDAVSLYVSAAGIVAIVAGQRLFSRSGANSAS